jgi:hypothetical protein
MKLLYVLVLAVALTIAVWLREMYRIIESD